MKQEEKEIMLMDTNGNSKQLLLKDLCGRLPYGVICKGISYDLDVIKDEYVNREVVGPLTKIECNYGTLGITKECELSTIKPYLRPMSSMTREERKELECIICDSDSDIKILEGTLMCIYISIGSLDWLNEHHFDYRGLIEKGLALKAPEGMYDIK